MSVVIHVTNDSFAKPLGTDQGCARNQLLEFVLYLLLALRTFLANRLIIQSALVSR